MKFKTKKINSSLIFLSTAAIVGVPLVTTVSCSNRVNTSYDFGLASKSINSLNYIKQKDTAQVIPSMVEGILKLGTANKIVQSNLTFPKMEYRVGVGKDENAQLSTRYYDMKVNSGILPGTAISSVDGNPIVALYASDASSAASALGIQLGSKHKWSNGDEVSAQDYIDTIKYILDINTGSQFIVDLQESGIRNATAIVEAQNEYSSMFNVPYQDPFGYDGYESQNAGDEAAVKKIKDAALSLGIFTARDYKLLKAATKQNPAAFDGKNIDDYLRPISWYGSDQSQDAGDDYTIKQIVDDAHLLFIQFEESQPQGYGDVMNQLISKNWFLPINRKFVESTGGIQKFGVDKEHFLWNSAFYPEELFLGPSGYIALKKDPLYYNQARTISRSIKIYFQSDPMVLASMFEDGYISQVQIPATHQLKFWSDLSMRGYMKKQGGFGTQALALNLDKSKGNKALQDANLRKAIAYAMDRNALTKVANEEASFPVTTWTAFGNIHDPFGIPIETVLDGQTYVPFDGAKDKEGNKANLPIQSYSYTNHNAKTNQFEQVDRTDVGFNVEYARHFLDEYKKANPNQKSVTLNYVYDGSNSVNKNIGIYIQSQLKSAFNGFINIEIKGLPSNVFESAKDAGDFDLIFYNFDSYGTATDSYIKRFFAPDQIESQNQKNTGFKENPSGGFTYGDWFKELEKDPIKEADVKKRLGFDQPKVLKGLDGKDHNFNIWAKLKSLSDQKGEDSKTYRERLQNFFISGLELSNANSGSYDPNKWDPNKDDINLDPAWQQVRLISEIVASFEKIIRESMPVIPLMEVDTFWTATTVAGVDSLSSFQLQTAYDINNKPESFPGIEALA